MEKAFAGPFVFAGNGLAPIPRVSVTVSFPFRVAGGYAAAAIAHSPQMRNDRCFVARKEASDGTHRCEHRDLAKPRRCIRVRHGPFASARMAGRCRPRRED